jgi:hypothetical protein
MKGLKVVLWIVAVIFLLNFLRAILPWSIVSTCAGWILPFDISGFQGLAKFIVRILSAGMGMIGVFYLLLALNPEKYGAMLPLSGYMLLVTGFFALVWGLYYSFPDWMWIVGVLFLGIFGGLILLWQCKPAPKIEQPTEQKQP